MPSQLIDICVIAVYLQVPSLVKSVANEIRRNFNVLVSELASVKLIRPSAQLMHQRKWKETYTFQWTHEEHYPGYVLAVFTAAIRSLYNHPGGAHRIPEIKDVLFGFLTLAGRRFITPDQLMALAREKDLADFMVDIAEASMSSDLAVRLRQPEDVTFRVMSKRWETKRLIRTQWSCSGQGCSGWPFNHWIGTDTFTADLRESMGHSGPGALRPSRYCQTCTEGFNVPQWLPNQALAVQVPGHPS